MRNQFTIKNKETKITSVTLYILDEIHLFRIQDLKNSTKTCFLKNKVACLNMRKYVISQAPIVWNNGQKFYGLLDGGNFHFL